MQDETMFQILENQEYPQRLFVGESYECLDGNIVTITDYSSSDHVKPGDHGYCVRGSDGAWRYAHSGRCTASKMDDPMNIDPTKMVNTVPTAVKTRNKISKMKHNLGNLWYHIKDKLEDFHII